MTTDPVSGFDSIIDQERPIRALLSFLTHGTIPHALLFTGIEGVGKRTVAAAFAMACNCSRPRGAEPCGECSACRRIAADTHPDILRVSPSGPQIKIEQVRELCRRLEMKPYEARVRVAIVAEAHRMNANAANALLKMLEEPPPATVLILTAPQPADLLPTIVSRCRHLRFKPLARDLLAGMLASVYGVPTTEAALTAAMSGGSVTRALALHRRGWARRRDWFLSLVSELPRCPVIDLLAAAERMARSKEDVPEFLELFESWLRDLAVAPLDPGRIVHQDRREAIVTAAAGLDDSFFDRAEAAAADLRRRLPNANSRLGLERLLVETAAAMSSGRR